MQLGNRLRTLRKERRYTLADVSKRTGLSVSFLSDAERGRTKPSLDTLEKLAECYEMAANEILGGVDLADTSDPPGFAQFLKSIEAAEFDQVLIDLTLQVERRANDRAKTPEQWREYYYSLKKILG